MFIRTKKIKNNEYAYLVENKLNKRNKKIKQKTKKYLGRVYKLPKLDNQTFKNNSKTNKNIIKTLITLELKNLGFKQTKNTFKSQDLSVDLNTLAVLNSKQNQVSIELNQGFLNYHTLNQILNYKQIQGTRKQVSKHLADAMVSAGLDIDNSTFILLFNQLYPGLIPKNVLNNS